MTEPTSPAVAKSAEPRPGPGVIKLVHGAEESAHDRLMKKHIPAWVVSGAFHVIILVLFIVVGAMSKSDARASDEIITTVVDDKPVDEKQPDLTNPDIGIDSDLKAAVEVERVEEMNVDAKVINDQPIGVNVENTTPMDTPLLAGQGPNLNDLGAIADAGNVMAGTGGSGGLVRAESMRGRSGATKEANLKAGGGNSESEAAVAKGLAWLAKEQRQNGSWVYDGSHANDTVASTGMSLLPFLAAGQTHKAGKLDYPKRVNAGLDHLLKLQNKNSGAFAGATNMYSHAIATIALCEAYGMTGDKAKLLYPCQAALNYIMKGQGGNGSWGYSANQEGDTSIVGWQIQALKSGEMCKDLQVDKKVLEKATKFLDSVSDTSVKSTYGYRNGPGTPASALSAVGLLCRYYLGYGPTHPALVQGVKDMVTRRPPNPAQFDMYFYYYATQVVHFHEGDAWHKDWNPKMRDMLVKMQVKGKGVKVDGSWDPDGGSIGSSCGRLGTTCMALLTLEVYYRHLPLYKRGNDGLKELERAK